jgi:hypothetical protein
MTKGHFGYCIRGKGEYNPPIQTPVGRMMKIEDSLYCIRKTKRERKEEKLKEEAK